LLMAVINFVNISIGTSSYRLKEIGLRKVFGSAKMQLIIQYLAESIILILISTVLSMLFYEAVRPLFSGILATKLHPVWQFSGIMFGSLLLLSLVIGLIAGIYPAFVLSSSNIIHAVKGKIDTAKGGMLLRRTLLVVQFTLATFIFISALNISKQVTYFFDKDLGYDKEKLLVITAFPKQWDSAGVKKMEMIRDGLLQVPAVKSASICFEVPDRKPPGSIDLVPGTTGNENITVVPVISVDENYAGTLGMKMKEGSFFKGYANSSHAGEIILNEQAMRAMGWTTALGKTVFSPDGTNSFTVSGVVKDFNFSTMQQDIGPLAFVHVRDTKGYRYLAVKLKSNDMSGAIAAVKTKWNNLSPGSPFDYNFMDDRFAALYQPELQLKKAAGVATFLNLLIVFMGIFGIVAFTLAKRLKEIAVRKVLGADIKNILFLFIKDYALLITIANVIAWPLAFIATNKWLQNYAYRVQQDMIPYFLVSVILFVTSFLFISAQCFRAASRSPVHSLRSE
jgi:putative ABC transport system permease protein